MILKEFDRLQAKPTAICQKLQDHKLILENLSLTEEESHVLGKYISFTKEDTSKVIRILRISNC